MTRVAAIDCGTNSIRLLIADVSDGQLTDVVRTLEVVRLGQGVDRTGRFADDALARTLAATRRYADLCALHGVERLRFVATSATRDASNRDAFLGPVRELLGVEPEVLDGRDEAELSFRGALSVLDTSGSAAATRLVVDLGGGSTELVLGDTSPISAFSMDVGCVRLTERHVTSDPMTPADRDALARDVRSALEEAGRVVDVSEASAVLGVAGTVTTITAHALGLPGYDPVAINGARLPLETVLAACDDLATLPRDARASLPYMHEGRVDVIAAGAAIWAEVLTFVREATAGTDHPLTEVITSEHDILDGVALSIA
ncbi:exopolyphosphatase/guanosine-5'-triphosphate,3'-diphosphate pyrophosphatase [Okibacterium sp. HSC-33S16]|uniref:Ppx/GppA phosphatase family protein n=1 Tax=Okibacterium sp. HSC-33S16 TaxID=2910965 RepID=UPI00273A6373|nr:Ppx/GppA phosphatase family protein [Okibacterium sp. HSC-33S16]MCP2031225.1 exopolyphosphatase/guanosine-5'-triphosphate,3'-diphosphate pyrophosphatase [Okibacterium sp. HSC-33S16]